MNPSDDSAQEAAFQRRRQIVCQEIKRLYPQVCVEGSPERETFLQSVEDSGGDLEAALCLAFAAVGGEAASAPPPRSPILHPETVTEQLTHVILTAIEFRNVSALEALTFVVNEGARIGDEMRGYSVPRWTFTALVPQEVLRKSRLTLQVPATYLGGAIRHVAEAVGLFTRLHEDTLLVCSWEVAEALDTNVREGYQTPLWETEDENYQPLVVRPSTEDLRSVVDMEYANSHGNEVDHSLFSAHYIVGGHPETALSIAEGLFRQRPFEVPIQDVGQSIIPGID